MLERLFSRVAQPLLQAGTGYAASILIRKELYEWLFVPAFILVLLNLLPAIPWWMNPSQVSILLQMVRDLVRSQPEEDVRCAIFRPSLLGRELLEVVMATASGTQQRKKKTRMKISQGVVGRVYRTKMMCCVPITRDWRTQLIEEFGFNENELLNLDASRRSYLCIPILLEHKVIAVLSFDSKSPETFTTERINDLEFFIPYFSIAIAEG